MGRGRARAKQAKIARERKYRTPATDLRALQQELAPVVDNRPLASAADSDGETQGKEQGGTEHPQ